jgi:hypothetical protein
MPQGWDQWGLVGAVVLAVLGLFGWLLKTSYASFVTELAASRQERKEVCKSFAETVGNHFHEFAEALGALTRMLEVQGAEQRAMFADLRKCIEQLRKE